MKNKKLLIIALTFISFILSACAETDIPEEVKYSYDLVDDFFLYKSNDDITFVATKTDGSNDEDSKIILENVSKIAWNENFILAEQIERIQLGKEEKEVYWIINPNNKKIYGPMEYKEFNEERKVLKVDQSLELKNPDGYLK